MKPPPLPPPFPHGRWAGWLRVGRCCRAVHRTQGGAPSFGAERRVFYEGGVLPGISPPHQGEAGPHRGNRKSVKKVQEGRHQSPEQDISAGPQATGAGQKRPSGPHFLARCPFQGTHLGGCGSYFKKSNGFCIRPFQNVSYPVPRALGSDSHRRHPSPAAAQPSERQEPPGLGQPRCGGKPHTHMNQRRLRAQGRVTQGRRGSQEASAGS